MTSRREIRRRRIGAVAIVTIVAVAVIALAGGGGGGGGGNRAGPSFWLVDTSGKPPSIAEENAQPGSEGWRLPAHFRRSGVVEGYVSDQDVLPGAGERLYVNAPTARWVRVRVFRIGWYGGRGGRLMAVDIGHSEYWSMRAARAFQKARDAGTGLAFFSSDTLAWRIRLRPATRASSEAARPDHRIVAYKEYAARDPGGEPATFPGDGASLTGSAYLGCITPRTEPAGPRIYRYYAWRPGPALKPAWLFRGSGLRPGSEISGVLGYELDRVTPRSPGAVMRVGGGQPPARTRRPPASPTRPSTGPPRAGSSSPRARSAGSLAWSRCPPPRPTPRAAPIGG